MPSSAVYDNVCKLLPWGYEQRELPVSHQLVFTISFSRPVGTEIQQYQWKQLYVCNSIAIFDSALFILPQ